MQVGSVRDNDVEDVQHVQVLQEVRIRKNENAQYKHRNKTATIT